MDIPPNIKPLFWYLRRDAIDVEKDKHDIIVNVVNEGTMDQWRWLIDAYGKDEIRHVLEQRLATEFHTESRHLAELLFDVKQFHAPRSINL